MANVDVQITRMNNFEYSFKLSTRRGIKSVATALTFDNPSPFSYSDTIEKFDKRLLTFKIGMLNVLLDYLRKQRIKYQINDYEYTLPENVTIDSRMQGKYIHQRNAVEAFYKRRFGIIQVPTRGGKTFIASEIARIFLNTDDGNLLFVVDNVTLFNQAVGDIKEFFENYGGVEVGEIRAGKIELNQRITVAMIQTLQSTLSARCTDKIKKNGLLKYLKDLKFLAVDEVHDNCSDSKLKIYKKCRKLEYQLCLSATPYRSGAYIQNLKLKEWSGDIVYEIPEEELRQRGVLSDYKVFLMAVDHEEILGLKDRGYDELRNEIILHSEVRNKCLLDIINILGELKLKTLVLFQSVEHGIAIEKLSGIPFISGRTKDDERAEAKDKFLEGEGGFLLASNIFKKGVTLPSVEVLLNVDGGLEDANTIQKKGRVLGTTGDKKKSLVIDFIDIYEAYFSKHSETRLNTYVKAVGEENIGVLDISSTDWKTTLKEWTKRWFDKDE